MRLAQVTAACADALARTILFGASSEMTADGAFAAALADQPRAKRINRRSRA